MLTMCAAASAATSFTQHDLCDERFLFHQMLAGVDVAVPRRVGAEQRKLFSMAKSMQNYMYLVGDAVTRECVAIDACYDPEGVVTAAESLGCNVTAAIGTHFHYDHIGHQGVVPMGPGLLIPGLDHFVLNHSVPTYMHAIELATAAAQIGVEASALSPLQDGDVLRVGAVEISVLHTPGHSPGGVTLVAAVDGRARLALTGDTLFPGSCGRLDLPGSSVDAMWASLKKLRENLDDELPIFPGHAYSGPSSTVAREKQQGLLRPMTKSEWRSRMRR
jgi:glyoxylase-like metal-dependent hydrolase (beta-lactamase superfamily II)